MAGGRNSNGSNQNQNQNQPASQANQASTSATASQSPASASAPAPAPPPPPTSGPPSKSRQKVAKTTADIVAESVGVQREKKRQRIHYSCAECHRRKHKCDRQTPCSACVERGIGDQCRPFQPGDQFGDVRDRVSRLEDLVEGLAKAQANMAKEIVFHSRKLNREDFNEMEESVSNWNSSSQRDFNRLSGRDEDDDGDAEDAEEDGEDGDENHMGKKRKRARSERSLGNDSHFLRAVSEREESNTTGRRDGANASGLTGSVINSSRKGKGESSLEGGLSREGDSWYGALALPSVSRGVIETEIRGEKLELSANFPRWPASVKLHRLIHEGGASPSVLTDLMSSLPSKTETDSLLDLYFRDINHTRLPLHEGTFRSSYDELMAFRWGNAKEEQGDDGARHLPFLSFLFIILATAKRSQPEDEVSEKEAKVGAMALYHSCRKAIAVASFIRVDHIDLVLAHLFAARFLTVNRQSAEAWSMLGFAIRAAQAIGLHRDGSKLSLDAVTTERRRRLWALLVYLDATTSILLGRPTGIQSCHTDTLPPSDLDIDTLPRTAPLQPRKAKPNQPPGVFNFLAIRYDLTKITGKVVEHFQNLSQERRYSDVLKLDEELQDFHKNLPPPYRTELEPDYDRQFDKTCPWLAIHRYLLNIEYHYIRIALHRPYVLRNSSKYSQSRTAAFESARADRLIRQEYHRDVGWPSNRARKAHMGGLYRLFNATMMIGIALLLDPNSSEAPDLITYLDEFIEKHRHAETQDQCSKREVKIIELFRTKAKDPTWCAATATGAKRAGNSSDGNEAPPAGSSGQIGLLPNIARVLGSGSGAPPPSGSSAGEGLASGSEAASGNGLPGLDQVSGSEMWNNSHVNNSKENQEASHSSQQFNNVPQSDILPSPQGTRSQDTNYLASSMMNAGGGGSSNSDGITPPSNQPWSNHLNNPSITNNSDLAQSLFDQLGLFDQFGMMTNEPSVGGMTNPEIGLGGLGNNNFDLFDKNNNSFDLSSPGLWEYNENSLNANNRNNTNNGMNLDQTNVGGGAYSSIPNLGPSRPSFDPSPTNRDPTAQQVADSNGLTEKDPSKSNSVDASMLPWGGLIEAISQVAPAPIQASNQQEAGAGVEATPTSSTAGAGGAEGSSSVTAAPQKKGRAKGKGKEVDPSQASSTATSTSSVKGRKSRNG